MINEIYNRNPIAKIACITYTNAAVHEIENRVLNKKIRISTIHDFLWDNISPFQNEFLFQIVEQGSINIYFIRDDGTRYSLSNGTTDYFLGDMDIFYPKSNNIYAEAAERLTCISFSIEKHREILLSNNKFLELICNSLSAKIGTMTTIDAAPTSLTERVMSYMKYKCNDETLKGIERAAFHLHCSARQLQRILNQIEVAGLVKKLGKGTYKLI